MNYETEYEFDSGLAVVIDYLVVWDIDREDRDYYFIEFDAVWADESPSCNGYGKDRRAEECGRVRPQ